MPNEQEYTQSSENIIEKSDTVQPEKTEREQIEQLEEQSKKLKKRMLIILGAVAGTLLVLMLVIFLINYFESRKDRIPDGFYTFYPPYEGDIMQNQDYLAKNRWVDYCHDPSGNGLRETITDQNRDQFDPSIQFLCEWLELIVAGDANGYNACFSAEYWKANEKEGNYKKTSFSQQMIYDAKITYQSTETDNGDKLITYKVEYFILRNDGSFRSDIGSGVSRPQYVTVRVSADESYVIIEKLLTVLPAN